jgi:hypothetical protein
MRIEILVVWAWWLMPAISALVRLKVEDHKFKGSLGYTASPCFKKKKKRNHGIFLNLEIKFRCPSARRLSLLC